MINTRVNTDHYSDFHRDAANGNSTDCFCAMDDRMVFPENGLQRRNSADDRLNSSLSEGMDVHLSETDISTPADSLGTSLRGTSCTGSVGDNMRVSRGSPRGTASNGDFIGSRLGNTRSDPLLGHPTLPHFASQRNVITSSSGRGMLNRRHLFATVTPPTSQRSLVSQHSPPAPPPSSSGRISLGTVTPQSSQRNLLSTQSSLRNLMISQSSQRSLMSGQSSQRTNNSFMRGPPGQQISTKAPQRICRRANSIRRMTLGELEAGSSHSRDSRDTLSASHHSVPERGTSERPSLEKSLSQRSIEPSYVQSSMESPYSRPLNRLASHRSMEHLASHRSMEHLSSYRPMENLSYERLRNQFELPSHSSHSMDLSYRRVREHYIGQVQGYERPIDQSQCYERPMDQSHRYERPMDNQHFDRPLERPMHHQAYQRPTHQHMNERDFSCSPPGGKMQMITVTPGLKLPLRGTAETLQAIRFDQVLSTECMVCNMKIFCVNDANYILCPECKTVGPASEQGGSQGGVGLGFTQEQYDQWRIEL